MKLAKHTLLMEFHDWNKKLIKRIPGVGPDTFLMEHVMTFRKLGQKTPTHPFHGLTVKKVPWYYSKSGPNTLHPIFGQKSNAGTFRNFGQKSTTHPRYSSFSHPNRLFYILKSKILCKTLILWSKSTTNTFWMRSTTRVLNVNFLPNYHFIQWKVWQKLKCVVSMSNKLVKYIKR